MRGLSHDYMSYYCKNAAMINERGCFMTRFETDAHICDEPLCAAIIKMYKDVKTAVDIGCGNGKYTRNLIAAGIPCKGYDGSPLTPEITDGLCEVMDFSIPSDIGQFDLVLCLEVGEHIPKQYEQVFIDNICRAADKHVCLSWALEKQDGWGHINCQNNDYVISEMRKRGFTYKPVETQILRDSTGLNEYIWWFKNTVMIFKNGT